MSKVRINDLARELEVKSKAILDVLTQVGVTEKKTHSSSLEEHEAEKVRAHFRSSAEGQSPAGRAAARAARGEEEIKTKIDLSHISRPGDVLKAITQRKEGVAAPPARPAVAPRRPRSQRWYRRSRQLLPRLPGPFRRLQPLPWLRRRLLLRVPQWYLQSRGLPFRQLQHRRFAPRPLRRQRLYLLRLRRQRFLQVRRPLRLRRVRPRRLRRRRA